MSRATLGTINPQTTSGTQLAALLSARDAAENSGHVGTGRPTYALEGMIYSTGTGASLRLFLAVGAAGPDVDLSTLFADRPGTMRQTAEVRLPVGWLWCDGSAQPRVTYPDLFNNICPTFTGSVGNASVTITAVSEDLRFKGLIGAKIEGAGVPGGTTVTAISVNTITMSAPGISAFPATPLRIFPHGNGNGSTTFNLPNAKGRVIVGRSDMGDGVDNGLITVAGGSGFDGTMLAAAGGVQASVLTLAHLPPHTHPVSVSGSAAISAIGNHTHGFYATTDAQGVHAHVPPAGSSAFFVDVPDPTGNLTVGSGTRAKFVAATQSAGNHAHNILNAQISLEGAHSHVATLTLGASSSAPAGAVSSPLSNTQPSIIENVVIKT